jgi:MFS family permease
MQVVAQSLLVLHLTGSPALTGLTASLQAAPGLLLGLLGGAAVDAWPRRLTAGVCQGLLGVIALITAGLAAAHLLGVSALLVLAVVTGVVATVDAPAVALLGNDLVAVEDLPSAIALGALASSAGRVIGTALAGITVAAAGVSVAYAANGLSFLLVAVAICFVRPLRHAQTSGARPGVARDTDGLRAGFRYLTGSRTILGLLLVGAVTAVLGRNYSLAFAGLVTGPLHGGAGSFGLVSAVLALGAVIGALVAGRLRSVAARRVAELALVGAVLQVVAAGSFGVPALLAVALPLAVVESVQDTLTGTILQSRPPAHLRGRVFGAWQTAAAGWTLVGPATFGWVLQTCGPRAGLAAGGLAIAAVAVAMRFVHLRWPPRLARVEPVSALV